MIDSKQAMPTGFVQRPNKYRKAVVDLYRKYITCVILGGSKGFKWIIGDWSQF